MQEVKIIPEEVKPIAVFCFYSGIWNGLWTAYHDPEERERFEEWKKERAAAQTSAPAGKNHADTGGKGTANVAATAAGVAGGCPGRGAGVEKQGHRKMGL